MVRSNVNLLPPLPRANANGNRPAVAFADAAIARGIIQRRKRLGLTQVGLAKLASIRVEVLNRTERAVTVPSMRTLIKIEKAIQELERRANGNRR
jgi:ribosome-binding protein aMBF1 (putative translation factor)